jgi:hypothetical protein
MTWSYMRNDAVDVVTYPGGNAATLGEGIDHGYANATGEVETMVGDDSYLADVDYHPAGMVSGLRGCYGGRLGAGVWTQYGEALAKPVGTIHWAGAETSAVWNGYMEGAIRSGRRAADEILGATSGSTKPPIRREPHADVPLSRRGVRCRFGRCLGLSVD